MEIFPPNLPYNPLSDVHLISPQSGLCRRFSALYHEPSLWTPSVEADRRGKHMRVLVMHATGPRAGTSSRTARHTPTHAIGWHSVPYQSSSYAVPAGRHAADTRGSTPVEPKHLGAVVANCRVLACRAERPAPTPDQYRWGEAPRGGCRGMPCVVLTRTPHRRTSRPDSSASGRCRSRVTRHGPPWGGDPTTVVGPCRHPNSL